MGSLPFSVAWVNGLDGRISFRVGRNSRLGARPPSAAACPGEPGRFGSGLRSPLPAVEDPCPLRPSTTSSGHRPCAIVYITRKEMLPQSNRNFREDASRNFGYHQMSASSLEKQESYRRFWEAPHFADLISSQIFTYRALAAPRSAKISLLARNSGLMKTAGLSRNSAGRSA